MKLFLLIHEQDTDAAWGSSVDLFSTLEAAQAEMRKIYEKTMILCIRHIALKWRVNYRMR